VRVCFLIDRLQRAGTETQLIALIRHLDRRRVLPALCLLDGEDETSRALEPADCPILRLGIRSLRHPGNLGKAIRLARFFREQRIDVVQVYFPDSSYFGVPVARLAGVPWVVRTRNNLGYWMTPLHRRLGRLITRLADRTIANSEVCRRAVIADEDAAPGAVVVLENGVDLDRFAVVPDLSRTALPRRVGMVANLRPVKGIELFIQAAAVLARRHPAVHFAVAGEGKSRPALERLIEQEQLRGRIHLPGSVADVPRFLARVDIAVLCSHSEGMPNALLEYMAAGRAIVATKVGAVPELIRDGEHGLLVPPGDADRLGAAIDCLLNDPALASRLGAAARRRAREQFSREAMVRRFEEFYHRLLAVRRPAVGRRAS
jgi:glycosyltransferase involved in cell wall biosynthesis